MKWSIYYSLIWKTDLGKRWNIPCEILCCKVCVWDLTPVSLTASTLRHMSFRSLVKAVCVWRFIKSPQYWCYTNTMLLFIHLFNRHKVKNTCPCGKQYLAKQSWVIYLKRQRLKNILTGSLHMDVINRTNTSNRCVAFWTPGRPAYKSWFMSFS